MNFPQKIYNFKENQSPMSYHHPSLFTASHHEWGGLFSSTSERAMWVFFSCNARATFIMFSTVKTPKKSFNVRVISVSGL